MVLHSLNKIDSQGPRKQRRPFHSVCRDRPRDRGRALSLPKSQGGSAKDRPIRIRIGNPRRREGTVKGSIPTQKDDLRVVEYLRKGSVPSDCWTCPCCKGTGLLWTSSPLGSPDHPDHPWEGRCGQNRTGEGIDTYGSFYLSPGQIERLSPRDPWWYNLGRHGLYQSEQSGADKVSGLRQSEGHTHKVQGSSHTCEDPEDSDHKLTSLRRCVH